MKSHLNPEIHPRDPTEAAHNSTIDIQGRNFLRLHTQPAAPSFQCTNLLKSWATLCTTQNIRNGLSTLDVVSSPNQRNSRTLTKHTIHLSAEECRLKTEKLNNGKAPWKQSLGPLYSHSTPGGIIRKLRASIRCNVSRCGSCHARWALVYSYPTQNGRQSQFQVLLRLHQTEDEQIELST